MTHETMILFEPEAQDSIIHPIAQAVCIARGGLPTKYVDSVNKTQRYITIHDLHFLNLKVRSNGKYIPLNASQVILKAKEQPLKIRLKINDVQLLISKNSDPQQVLKNFKRMLLKKHQNNCDKICYHHKTHQHE